MHDVLKIFSPLLQLGGREAEGGWSVSGEEGGAGGQRTVLGSEATRSFCGHTCQQTRFERRRARKASIRLYTSDRPAAASFSRFRFLQKNVAIDSL